MKDRIAIMLAMIGAAASAQAGTISGHVRAEGKAGAEQGAASGNYDSRAFKFVERVDYGAMRDFVVYIEGPVTNGLVEKNTSVVSVTTTRISQQKATFTPHVMPVMVGATVEWPNRDDIYHNVFSYSEAKPFDLGLYKSEVNGKRIDPPAVQFDKPGRVDVFCSIHANMNCVVLVVENPFFALTNEKGNYSIASVPAGNYRLKAWHERLPPQVQSITVPSSGEIHVDFTLGITGLPRN